MAIAFRHGLGKYEENRMKKIWNKGEPEGLKDKALIIIKDINNYFSVGRYNLENNWIDMLDREMGLWALEDITCWMRLDEPPEMESR